MARLLCNLPVKLLVALFYLLLQLILIRALDLELDAEWTIAVGFLRVLARSQALVGEAEPTIFIFHFVKILALKNSRVEHVPAIVVSDII